jgi:hypothetical protein
MNALKLLLITALALQTATLTSQTQQRSSRRTTTTQTQAKSSSKKTATSTKKTAKPVAASRTTTGSDLTRGIKQPSEIYSMVIPSTVMLKTDIGSGSGFYVKPNVIATNYHVIKGAEWARCSPDNSYDWYEITGYLAVDEAADLALLQVSGPRRKPLPLASGNVVNGQQIYAFGAPQQFYGTISDGLVTLRLFEGIKLLQISAPISPGSSGGPIVNRFGEVVGVASMTHTTAQNLNLAIDYHHLADLMQYMSSYPVSLSALNRRYYAYDDSYGRSQSYGNSGRRSSSSSYATGRSSSSYGRTEQRQQSQSQASERFRRDYNYIAVYDPDREQWSEWVEGINTVVFNINRNGDIRIYYSSGKQEVFRKISDVRSDSTTGGEEYQMVAILDEEGDEQYLQLFNNGDMRLILSNGIAIHLTNSGD